MVSQLKDQRLAVVVQGELAQSPRMANHARALLAEGAVVDLVGYAGVDLPEDLAAAEGLKLHRISSIGTRRWHALPQPLFLAAAALRAAWLAFRLSCVLITLRTDGFLVQNPPALPVLLVTWIAARLRRAQLVVDWHNYTWSMLGLRLGPTHFLVRRVERLEGWLARHADSHLCVSAALAQDLARRWGIDAVTLHDRPQARAAQLEPDARRDVLNRIETALGRDCGAAAATLPAILVSPTSWSADEDTGLLLDAVTAFARRPETPPTVLFVTGLGPGRAAFEARAMTLAVPGLRVVTGWLPEALYRDLLQSADLGLSVHRSTSGLDLPMKLVDMLEAGLPALAFDYGPCLGELTSAASMAGMFTDAAQLAEHLALLLADHPASGKLAELRARIARLDLPLWREEWRRQALPLFAAMASDRPSPRRWQGDRRRALVVHPTLQDRGGGNCVAAWALQALREDFAVTLLAWAPFDLERVNAAFGTALKPEDFRLELVPRAWCAAIARAPIRLALLQLALLQRHARSLVARERFDLVIGTSNEIDVGRRAIQYVHFPWAHYQRHETEYRWYHLAPLVRLYRGGIIRLCGLSLRRIARNETLVNSAWTGRRFSACYGVEPRILHPPVAVDRAPLPWSARQDSFVCVGRISPEKRILEIIEILAAVRRRGHPVSLFILGQRDNADYERQVLDAAAAHSDWISLAFDVPRAELLDRIALCRFGIHGMIGEHFGIAAAEMARLGCVTFAPEDGGPAEILGGDPRLLYSSSEDAIDKICAVLEDSAPLASLSAQLVQQAAPLSAQAFVTEFRKICDDFCTAEAATAEGRSLARAQNPPDPRRFSAPLRGWLKRVLPEPVAQALGRLYRLAYPFWIRATGSRAEWVETPTGRYCLPLDAPHDAIARAIRAGGVFEEEVVELATEYLRPGATILDIGANFGQMSVLFSRAVGRSGRVIAVEANPFVFDLLTRNLAANGCRNAEAIWAAAYRDSGRTLRFPEPRFWREVGYGSYGVDPRGGRGAKVPSLALDDLDIPGRVDFIKIDAQGSDLDVLRGARRLIARDRMPILLEYGCEFDRAFGVTFADYEAFIAEIGYRISRRMGDDVLIESKPRICQEERIG